MGLGFNEVQWEGEGIGFPFCHNMLIVFLYSDERTKAAVNRQRKQIATFRFHVFLSNFWLFVLILSKWSSKPRVFIITREQSKSEKIPKIIFVE